MQQKKIGAIDPELKAEIDWMHDLLDRYFKSKLERLRWYLEINRLAKRI